MSATRVLPLSLLLASLALPMPAQTAGTLGSGDFRIRTVLPAGGGAYTQVIVLETAASVVVFDAGSSRPHADSVLALVRSTGKPLVALMLTHGHVDHYGGAGVLRSATTPMITGVGVARQIAEYDSLNFARFGAAPPVGRRQPDRVLGHGESLEVDGVRITLNEAGPGESYSDVWYWVTGERDHAIVLGDLVMYGIPPFAQSGHTGDWIRSLETLRALLPTRIPVYLGHDRRAISEPGKAWSADVLDLQLRRITEFREAVRRRTGAARLLTDDEVREVVRELLAAAPENDPRFGFLISTSANVLAAELILEGERAAFEGTLRKALAGPRPD